MLRLSGKKTAITISTISLIKMTTDKEKVDETKGKTKGKAKPEKTPVPATPVKSPPIKNIIITSIGVNNANLVYADYSKPKITSLKCRILILLWKTWC